MVVKTPLSKALFKQAFRLAYASKNRMAGLLQENRKLCRKIEDMGIVDRAKCVLIQVLKMTEPQAHRYIEKTGDEYAGNAAAGGGGTAQKLTNSKGEVMTKFIFVTGGVVSGLGKGITAASLGRLLKARG